VSKQGNSPPAWIFPCNSLPSQSRGRFIMDVPLSLDSPEEFDQNVALQKILQETEGNCKMAMQLCHQLMEKNENLEDEMDNMALQFEFALQKSKEKVKFLKKKLEHNKESKEELKYRVLELEMKMTVGQCYQEFDYLDNQEAKIQQYKRRIQELEKIIQFWKQSW